MYISANIGLINEEITGSASGVKGEYNNSSENSNNIHPARNYMLEMFILEIMVNLFVALPRVLVKFVLLIRFNGLGFIPLTYTTAPPALVKLLLINMAYGGAGSYRVKRLLILRMLYMEKRFTA